MGTDTVTYIDKTTGKTYSASGAGAMQQVQAEDAADQATAAAQAQIVAQQRANDIQMQKDWENVEGSQIALMNSGGHPVFSADSVNNIQSSLQSMVADYNASNPLPGVPGANG